MINKKEIIAIGSDHAGLELKNTIKKFLTDSKIRYKDYGVHKAISVDYPDYGIRVAESVASGKHKKGILICGTGIGLSIVANKVPGIRAALCGDIYTARMSRLHNDSNILVLAGRITGIGLAVEIVKEWLKTKFSNDDRHSRRLKKIRILEEKYGRT